MHSTVVTLYQNGFYRMTLTRRNSTVMTLTRRDSNVFGSNYGTYRTRKVLEPRRETLELGKLELLVVLELGR